MKWLVSVLVLALVPLSLAAQDVRLPETKEARYGRPVFIPVETKGTDVVWVSLHPDVDIIPSGLLKDPKVGIVFVAAPGGSPESRRAVAASLPYTVMAYSAVDGKPTLPAYCTLSLGGVKPPDPVKPDPVKPDPVKPGPVKPGPADPVTRAFQDAYDKETDPKKAEHLVSLIGVLENAVQKARDSKNIFDARQLSDGVSAATDLAVGRKESNALPLVRKAVGTELLKTLPPAGVFLKPEDWAKASDAYKRVAASLKGVK